MTKSYLIASLLALSTLTACTNNIAAGTTPSEKPAVSGELKEIQVPNPLEKYNFSDWNVIFGSANMKDPKTGEVNQVITDRVAAFGSADALQADVEQHASLMPDQANKETQIALAMAITQAYNEKVDFKTQDLVVVHLSAGGPPFGEYGYKSVGKNSWEFCIQPPVNTGGASGMALQTQFRFYTAPKGVQVSKCKKQQ